MASETKKLRKNNDDNAAGQDLDAATQKYLELVDLCQVDIDNINLKAAEEVLEIEKKFNLLRKPHFEKRSDIIKNIPNFWITAMMNHPDLSTILDESEEECLHHLTKIEVEDFEDIEKGYRIEFYFEENPFFDNAVLTKEFHLENENSSSKSTEIKWKEGANLLQKNADCHSNSNNKGGRKRRIENKSFFSWFTDNIDATSDDIAEAIKEDLWISPLQYYLVPDIESTQADEEELQSSEEDETSGTSQGKNPTNGRNI